MIERCCYCEIELTEKSRSRDHLIAKSKGGNLTMLCCKNCNMQKSNFSLEIFALCLEYFDPIGNHKKIINARRIRKEILFIQNLPVKNKEVKVSNFVRLIEANSAFSDDCPF